MNDRRGLTLIELLLFIIFVGAAVAAIATGSWRPFIAFGTAIGILFVVLLLLAGRLAWGLRVSLPRQLRLLDRLERTDPEGREAAAALARLRNLLRGLPLNPGLNVLEERIDRKGAFRHEFLKLVEVYVFADQARDLLQRLVDRGDPLAEQARELLAKTGERPPA